MPQIEKRKYIYQLSLIDQDLGKCFFFFFFQVFLYYCKSTIINNGVTLKLSFTCNLIFTNF